MTRVSVSARVPGDVDDVRALWYDVRRWPSFVEGFGHVTRRDPEWPQEGTLVWQSKPHGRGTVVERADGGIQDDQVVGRQEVTFTMVPGGEVEVTVELEYELRERAPLSPLVDRLFIRRAQRDALARTLRRFAIEAAADVSAPGGR